MIRVGRAVGYALWVVAVTLAIALQPQALEINFHARQEKEIGQAELGQEFDNEAVRVHQFEAAAPDEKVELHFALAGAYDKLKEYEAGARHLFSANKIRLEMHPHDAERVSAGVEKAIETFTAHRAYDLARRYRDKGVPVVMGGYHATFLPDEALEHATWVVRGEADSVILPLVDAVAFV